MKTFALSYIPLGGNRAGKTLALVRASTFAEAAQKLPAYERVEIASASRAQEKKLRQSYLARIQK